MDQSEGRCDHIDILRAWKHVVSHQQSSNRLVTLIIIHITRFEGPEDHKQRPAMLRFASGSLLDPRFCEDDFLASQSSSPSDDSLVGIFRHHMIWQAILPPDSPLPAACYTASIGRHLPKVMWLPHNKLSHLRWPSFCYESNLFWIPSASAPCLFVAEQLLPIQGTNLWLYAGTNQYLQETRKITRSCASVQHFGIITLDLDIPFGHPMDQARLCAPRSSCFAFQGHILAPALPSACVEAALRAERETCRQCSDSPCDEGTILELKPRRKMVGAVANMGFIAQTLSRLSHQGTDGLCGWASCWAVGVLTLHFGAEGNAGKRAGLFADRRWRTYRETSQRQPLTTPRKVCRCIALNRAIDLDGHVVHQNLPRGRLAFRQFPSTTPPPPHQAWTILLPNPRQTCGSLGFGRA